MPISYIKETEQILMEELQMSEVIYSTSIGLMAQCLDKSDQRDLIKYILENYGCNNPESYDIILEDL